VQAVNFSLWLGLIDLSDPKDINRLKFLARSSTEIGKRV
jgi:hypothetical protein